MKLTLVAVLVAAMLAASASASTGPPRPTIDWAPCEEDPTAECGTLSVPVDWSERDGPRIDLAVARRVTTGPGRVGSLVFAPGGPGDPGRQRILTGMSRFSDELRRRFDIVSFDPRGVGRSAPATCSTADRPPPVLTSQADFDATVEFNRRLYEECENLDHRDSVSAAHDLDALRAALGERKLTLHGSSYGTLLGEMYAERYPHRVRALVLESAMDHSVGTRGFLEPQARAVQDSFDEFVAWCEATPDCALYGRNARAVWHDVLGRASEGELGDVTPWDVRVTAFRAFYQPNWRSLAGNLLSAHTGGDFTAVRLPPVAFPVFCGDWALPVRDYNEYAALMRRLAELSPDTGYPPAVFAVTLCLGWPEPPTNPQHRLRIRGLSTPMLLLRSAHDPGTGDTWAAHVARQAGPRNAVTVTYEGRGHGAYSPRTNPCATSVVDRYLIDLTVPRPGTTCPPVAP